MAVRSNLDVKSDANTDLVLGQMREAQADPQLPADVRSFETLSHDAQHRVRKRLKRLRYLAELVASLYAPSRVERYLAALRDAVL